MPEKLKCEVCQTSAGVLHSCLYYCPEPRWFCRQHFADHLGSEHADNSTAQAERDHIVKTGIYAEGHPCKWHEGDECIEQDPDPEKYLAPGCQGCGAMYNTKDCEGCGKEFLDWEAKGFDDIIAGPYVSSSGDLYCMRCGPRMDREEQDAIDEAAIGDDYDYDQYGI